MINETDAFLAMSLTEVAKAIVQREVSSVALTQAAIARARIWQSQCNAFTRIDEEDAIHMAQACDDDLARGVLRGPLHGVPLAHKDMFYRKGKIANCGSKVRENWVANTTATVLEKLDTAGAIQIGSLHMTEFAYGPTGQNAFLGDAKNPWNPAYIPGGSSSGSGIATAARIVFAALGSDTAGSVRMPASLCGVVGMKTTMGLVSRAGCMPLSASLDTIGPLTRTVEDNALLLSIIAGHDPRDAASVHLHDIHDIAPAMVPRVASLKGYRIGIPMGYFDENLEEEIAQRIAAVIQTYRDLQAEVVAIPMPDLDAINAAGILLTWGDVISIHGRQMRQQANDYTAQTRGRIEVALGVGVQDYLDAKLYQGKALRMFASDVFSKCDALLAPALSFPVPQIAEVDVAGGPKMMRILDEITRLMRPANMLGLPSLAIPCGFTNNGMPCGFQLMGRPYAERQLYQLGMAYQGVTDWHTRSPQI